MTATNRRMEIVSILVINGHITVRESAQKLEGDVSTQGIPFLKIEYCMIYRM